MRVKTMPVFPKLQKSVFATCNIKKDHASAASHVRGLWPDSWKIVTPPPFTA